MKTVRLRYHWGLEFCRTLFVNVGGLALTYYLWWRIRELSCFELDLTILSVAIGYTGFALLYMAKKYEKRNRVRGKLIRSDNQVDVIDFKGRYFKNCKVSIEHKSIFGICVLRIKDEEGRKARLKYVSSNVDQYIPQKWQIP